LTLIVGVRGKDGVVVASDSKVLRGGEAEFTNKLYEVDGKLVYAIEGLTGVADDFNLLFESERQRLRDFDSLYNAKVVAEDIVAELSKRYTERVQQPTLGLLMGGLENLTYGEAQLYYIHDVGYGEKTAMICSGSGGRYATTLAKFLLKRDLTVEELAKRAVFIIAYVAEDVDVQVGGQPSAVMIRDTEQVTPNPLQYINQNELEKMVEKAKQVKENLPDLLDFKSSQ